MLALLERVDGKAGRLFPGRGHNAMLWTLKRIPGCDGYTVHGFRSSFRDWCGNETAFARDVVEETYGHEIGNDVERAYRRQKAMKKRRQVLEAWNRYATEFGDRVAVPEDGMIDGRRAFSSPGTTAVAISYRRPDSARIAEQSAMSPDDLAFARLCRRATPTRDCTMKIGDRRVRIDGMLRLAAPPMHTVSGQRHPGALREDRRIPARETTKPAPRRWWLYSTPVSPPWRRRSACRSPSPKRHRPRSRGRSADDRTLTRARTQPNATSSPKKMRRACRRRVASNSSSVPHGRPTSPPGSDSFPGRSRPETARSSARYPSATIATCGFCSCKRPGSCWIKPRVGSAMTLNPARRQEAAAP